MFVGTLFVTLSGSKSVAMEEVDLWSQFTDLQQRIEELKTDYAYLCCLNQEESSLKGPMDVNSAETLEEDDSDLQLQYLQAEKERIQLMNELHYFTQEIRMLEEESTDLFDAIHQIVEEKAMLQSKIHKKEDEIELSKQSIDFFMGERDGLLKAKETQTTRLKTYEAYFRRNWIALCEVERKGVHPDRSTRDHRKTKKRKCGVCDKQMNLKVSSYPSADA